MDAVITDRVSHSFGSASAEFAEGYRFDLIRCDIRGSSVFCPRYKSVRVQTVGKIIFSVVIEWRTGPAAFPLIFDSADGFMLRPFDQVRGGKMSVVMGARLKFTGMMTAVQQIKQMYGKAAFAIRKPFALIFTIVSIIPCKNPFFRLMRRKRKFCTN